MKSLFKNSIFILCLSVSVNALAQNVGVGNTTPLGKLHIKGSANNSQLIIDANSIQINTAPLIKLRSSIGNDILWIHSDTTFNTFIGLNAGRVNNAIGGALYNTFIGRDAGYSNTSGSYNSAFGKGTLYTNTTGSYNTASGQGALFSNTTGSLNSAYGHLSLNFNTTGFLNSAYGYGSLYSNTTGKWNSAFGARTLFSNTTGVYNTALGLDALYSNINGAGNTAIGNSALYENTSGYQNSAQGYLSLRYNTTGYENTATGPYSMISNSTGSQNTALGLEALFSNTTGTYNTAIGAKANVATGALNNATAIGAHASVSTSNSLVLGSIAGVNGATSNTNVGIGTSAPNTSAKLEVASTSQGLLIPRMTTAQRKLISSPAAGLMVYDLDKLTIYMYDGLKWNPMLYTTNEQKLPGYPVQASDGETGDNFGASVSIKGDYALVAATNNDVGSNVNQGSVYVFVRNSGLWQQQAILTSSTGISNEYFGTSVELNGGGDVAIIGAPGATINGNNYQGCAYIFIRTGSTWTQQAILTASDGTQNDSYGLSVSIKDDYAIVGAYLDNSSTGSAYVYFKNSQWMDHQPHQSKLNASDGANNDIFGLDVSISGDYAIVGAPGQLGNNGAIYIFNRSGTTWSQLAKIEGASGEALGNSVSIEGDYIAAGCQYHNSRGAIKIYSRGSGWVNNQTPQATLIPSDLNISDKFGYDVSISSDFIIGGTLQGAGFPGTAYLYKRTGSDWNLFRKFTDEFPVPNARFGQAVSINVNNLIIGIPFKNNYTGEVQFINIE